MEYSRPKFAFGLIPTLTMNDRRGPNRGAPRTMIFQGWSMSVFQAKQQWSTISSYDLNTVRQPVGAHELPDVFLGIEYGERAGSGKSVMLRGTLSDWVTCQPARSSSKMAWAPGATWGSDLV